ncbi:MAG: hypothetical protein JNN13_15630 [Planctomycetes bacterium]|nr:hypothetical protein [Planctomycetota bacterium]
MNPARLPVLLLLACVGLPGCIASNVVAAKDRQVVVAAAELPWQPAPSAALDGLYESVDVRGDAAVSLRKVYYVFQQDGSYTGAALTEVEGCFRFQTLAGTWRCGADGLSLDDAPPVQLDAAPDHLRITAPTGVLVLRRGSLL